MEDKTPIYMLVIVAIVAVVGVIIMMTNTASPAGTTTANMISGNVVAEQSPTVTVFGKVFFVVFLFGVAGYMYFRKE